MKRKKLMMTAVLAFFGVVFLAFSAYLLYKNTDSSVSATKQKELEEAIKQIEVLNAEIVQKDKLVEETEQKIKSMKSESMSVMGQNMPIIEIVDNDLSDEEAVEQKGSKKVHKLMYHHQIRFFILNAGKNSLKDVIFSIKDDYNRNKEKKKKTTSKSNVDYTGKKVDSDELGTYENIEVNTLNLKTKKLIYTSNLPGSFGVGDYEYHLIIEWSQGFYQMVVKIEELNGKLKFNYEFFDVDGKPIDFKNVETSMAN